MYPRRAGALRFGWRVGVCHQVAPDLDVGALSDEVDHTSASATLSSASVSKT